MKIRLLRELFVLAFLPAVMFGAGGTVDITGRIIGGAGEGIPGITVALRHAGHSALTDSEGFYVITGTAGTRMIYSSALGSVAPHSVQLQLFNSFPVRGSQRRFTLRGRRQSSRHGNEAVTWRLVAPHREPRKKVSHGVAVAPTHFADTLCIYGDNHDTLYVPTLLQQEHPPIILPLKPISYRIADWHLFYKGALSLCFDRIHTLDSAAIDTILTSLSDRERRIGATMYLDPCELTESDPRLGLLRKAVARGYDVGVGLYPESPSQNIDSCIALCEGLLGDYTVVSLDLSTVDIPADYPEKILTVRTHRSDTVYTSFPANRFDIADHHISKLTKTALTPLMDSIIVHRLWIPLSFDTRGDDFIETMNSILQYHPSLWDCSMSDAASYKLHAQSAKLNLIDTTTEEWTFTLSPTAHIPGPAIPLTIQYALPYDWSSITVLQDRKPVWGGVVSGRARFSVYPNGKRILVKKL